MSKSEVLDELAKRRAKHAQAIIESFDVVPTTVAPAKAVHGIVTGAENVAAKSVALAWQRKGKKIVATCYNLELLLRSLNITVRYNVIRKELEINIPGQSFTVDNNLNCAMAYIKSAANGIGMPVTHILEYLTLIGDQNCRNPVVDWIGSKPWDGKSRWADFCETLIVAEDRKVLRNTVLRRWMLSALAAAYEPKGVSAHGMLVLQGAQGLGKTFWFKKLVPEELEVIQDGMLLDPKDKDSVTQCAGNWLVELGEVDATFRKADISHLKSFLTKQTDVLRQPYAIAKSTFARRTVFFASVNPETFLHDDTGNRRFWTLACLGIKLKKSFDMQQVWAELYETGYAVGEAWILSEDEQKLLDESNKQFEAVDPIEENLMSTLDWSAPEDKWVWRTLTELAKTVIRDPNKAQVSAVKKILLGKKSLKTRVVRGYTVVLSPPSVLGFS